MKQAELVARAEQLARGNSGSNTLSWATNVLTLAEALRGTNHAVVAALKQVIELNAVGKINDHRLAVTAEGISRGLLDDLKAGFIPDLETRIRGDVAADLLGQALVLLEDHFKDPAAMLIGAVLEDALRQLCRKHSVPEGKGIEAMNEPLRKAGVLSLPQKQQVTAWAALRNKADHGHFDEYTEPEVRLMHQGVVGFVATFLGGA